MKEKVYMNKNGKSGYLIKEEPIQVLKSIFNIEGNFEIKKEQRDFLLYCNNELICKFNITYSELFDYIINIYYKGCVYHYYCDDDIESLRLNMMEYNFNRENKDIRIFSSSYSVSADIIENDKGIAVEIGEKIENLKMFEQIVSSLKMDDSLEKIYNKLSIFLSDGNIKIKKYSKMNTVDYREKVTDLLIVRDGILQSYLTSVDTNIYGKNMRYELKKDMEGYSVSFNGDSIAEFNALHFVLGEKMRFVSKLEFDAKKKLLSKKNK